MRFLLTNHETLYNLYIVLSLHPPFGPITALFTITGLWPAVGSYFNSSQFYSIGKQMKRRIRINKYKKAHACNTA